LRRELSRAISTELSDPRLSPMYTVTRVHCSPDLSHASVYVSAPDDSGPDTIAALHSSAPVIRRSLRGLNLKKIPQLAFRLDDSVQKGDEVLRLLDRVSPSGSSGR
jgi:ribosome-binding factor A